MKIPVILFAYARPDCLRKTLESLRANRVTHIRAFSDGPRTPVENEPVAEVRKILRCIDWCDVVLCEREKNLGLGTSILTGVTDVFNEYEAAIVVEDDLICVPGAYAYLCAALETYRTDSRVMSVTGWTHPLVTPHNITHLPYFDGRAECLMWGTWNRVWRGMNRNAKELMEACQRRGIGVYRYGADLPAMAEVELRRNIWAVRFLYWHILNRGLCLRPPWSMVEHIGYGPDATNATTAEGQWASLPLRACPPIPPHWPLPRENSQCPKLWQRACGQGPTWHSRLYGFARGIASRVLSRMSALLD